MGFNVANDFIAEQNRSGIAALEDDYGSLGRRLARRGVDVRERETAPLAPVMPLFDWTTTFTRWKMLFIRVERRAATHASEAREGRGEPGEKG